MNPVLQRNGFFGHPEFCYLVAMIPDEIFSSYVFIDLIDWHQTDIADHTDAIIRNFIMFNENQIVGFLRFIGRVTRESQEANDWIWIELDRQSNVE